MTGYTVEADVRGREQRRQRGDVGLINQRYGLVLFGNGQKLELHPWQAADEMTVRVPFKWDADKWYRMKLRVDNCPTARRACAARCGRPAMPEPAAWTIEKIDKIPHHEGSPGIYADGISEVYFDNVKVYKNQVGHRANRPNRPTGIRITVNASNHSECGSRSRGVVRGVRGLADVGRHAEPQHGVADEGPADDVGRQDRQEREVGRRARLAVLRQSRPSPAAWC